VEVRLRGLVRVQPPDGIDAVSSLTQHAGAADWQQNKRWLLQPPINRMSQLVVQHAHTIFNAAVPVIRIFDVGGKRWKRNVAKGSRIGPWLQATYEILDESTWRSKGPCLYLDGANAGSMSNGKARLTRA
jgi:hypothetical protein